MGKGTDLKIKGDFEDAACAEGKEEGEEEDRFSQRHG